MKSKIEPGNQVSHKRYGRGLILREWESFHACPECYAQVQSGIVPTPCHDSTPIEISGKGIFEVQFDEMVHSVHEENLDAELH